MKYKTKIWQNETVRIMLFVCFAVFFLLSVVQAGENSNPRQRILFNDVWHFFRYDSADEADTLIYDERPHVRADWDFGQADDKPTEADEMKATKAVLKPWILPSGNDFIKDPQKKHRRPEGFPGYNFPFVQLDFDDSQWEEINLPHDWAIKGPFYEGENPVVRGGMGRLPIYGVAWYRKTFDVPKSDAGKTTFLEVDGAMSYAMVWLNGYLVGGWPFGYSSWHLNLTPYIKPGEKNQLAIRLDNPKHSSRWYPGSGIYRNVWLTKVKPLHVAQWGTFVTTPKVSKDAAQIDLEVTVDNSAFRSMSINVKTDIYQLDKFGNRMGEVIASFDPHCLQMAEQSRMRIKGSVKITKPKLWGPPPTQTPNLYVAVTTLWVKDIQIDQYETRFGIRSLEFDPDQGLLVNGELIKFKGVNQHHDLGALGAAFNYRAAERQLEMLQEMGCNAIRMAHNPPAPELLELTDRMGFLVIDESFDVWERKKTPLDFHLIFPEWHEQDMRALVRRDRNCPSVIMWSSGNEVGEQYTSEEGARVGKILYDIIKDEDPTRPVTASMNWAKPYMPFPDAMDVISLNYQGEGIRQDPMFEGTNRIRTKPQYPTFHEQHPDKVIVSSETASSFSSRGIYLFPVTDKISDITRDGRGGDSKMGHVSSYSLHAVDFGASTDKVFGSLERHPYVAGEFVWTGWDHMGEPTPYYSSRSSYCGMIDLAGFKKDRFYLYQSHWRPELPMAHILPHWNWPERVGKLTPIHVFTSGDEAELFINGESKGRKKKGDYEYRLRWDDIKYEPGEVKVIAYKEGKKWAEDKVKTTGKPEKLIGVADRDVIQADGYDLSFITVRITDKKGLTVPTATNLIEFEIEGAGEIVATDNGDPTDFDVFSSHKRKAFSGLALAIVRSKSREQGKITLVAKSDGLKKTKVVIKSK